ncbi:MAG: hypothetical protein KDA93_05475 [Planctomycetaceae bacterium]|nr:hypothetical protein [Planctomycetaceae bacterium]
MKNFKRLVFSVCLILIGVIIGAFFWSYPIARIDETLGFTFGKSDGLQRVIRPVNAEPLLILMLSVQADHDRTLEQFSDYSEVDVIHFVRGPSVMMETSESSLEHAQAIRERYKQAFPNASFVSDTNAY